MPLSNMINQSKSNDPRFWAKWKASGAVGNINGIDVGEAYAFFDCNAPMTQVAQEIPKIRKLVETHKGLELFLAKDALPLMRSNINNVDPELVEIALNAKDAGIKYVLAARSLPNMTNRQTAEELSTILNQAYQSPLYQEGEKFRGEVVYKERENYVFME